MTSVGTRLHCRYIYFPHIPRVYTHFQAKPDTLPLIEVTVILLVMFCDTQTAMETELCLLAVHCTANFTKFLQRQNYLKVHSTGRPRVG